jgi:hypothetical protein
MFRSAQTNEQPGLTHWLAHWWHDYRFSRTRLLNFRDQLAGASTIHGLDIARPELRVFAGKWPDASGLLSNRMEQVKLDLRESVINPRPIKSD